MQPPRGQQVRHLGIQSILSPASPDWPAGAFPHNRNHRAFGIFAVSEKPGQKRQPSFAAIRAGQYGHFSAASRLPFSAGDRHRPRVPSLIAVPVSSPFREGFLPENVPRRFGSLKFLAPYRVLHAACLCPRSVSAGQAMTFVLPLFRRCVSHAGRDGRPYMNAGQLLDIYTDAMINHLIESK